MRGEGWRETYGCEGERVDFDAEGCDVFFLELACQVTLHEGGLVEWVSM